MDSLTPSEPLDESFCNVFASHEKHVKMPINKKMLNAKKFLFIFRYLIVIVSFKIIRLQ